MQVLLPESLYGNGHQQPTSSSQYHPLHPVQGQTQHLPQVPDGVIIHRAGDEGVDVVQGDEDGGNQIVHSQSDHQLGAWKERTKILATSL